MNTPADQAPTGGDFARPCPQDAPRRLLSWPNSPLSIPKGVRLWTLRAALASGVSAYLGGMAILSWVVSATTDLPSVDKLTERSRPASVRIVDRYNRELIVRGANAGGHVNYDRLPLHVPAAIMAVEDERYPHHIGVDVEGIARAFLTNLKTGRRGQGGSTLTQQLVKNVFLTPEKTYRRKIQEALLAIWLERAYTKNEIVEMYLERVYFGSGTWGLEAASRQYFGKRPEELDLAEAALLAGLLKAPSAYNPVANPDVAGSRTALVLSKMEELRYIDRQSRARALLSPLSIRPSTAQDGVNYFVDWIWPEIESQVGIITSDLVVRTSLNADVQAMAESAALNHLDPDRGADQAAIVTLDATGGVLGLVGGRAYADSQFNRATQAVRQPGSSFKPFVYLSAFEAGVTPWDMRIDAPLSIDGWEPKNFKDKYFGAVTLEDAFGRSLNSVAVTLSREVGAERVVETAARFGLDDLQPLRSIALGAQGARPMDMAAAYLPFGNWGERREPYGILSIETASGIPLYTAQPAPAVRVVRDGPLRDMNRLMMRTVEQGTGRNARVPGRSIAGKTGTTNESRDAWFVGVAPGYVTSVWVGNDANDPMNNITGGSIPARIFADVMAAVLMDAPNTSLPISQTPIWARPEDRSLEALLSDIEGVLP